MRRAYLLVFVPAAVIGLCYVVLFRSMGYSLQAFPFIAVAVGIVAAILLVRYYLHRHLRRPGR